MFLKVSFNGLGAQRRWRWAFNALKDLDTSKKEVAAERWLWGWWTSASTKEHVRNAAEIGSYSLQNMMEGGKKASEFRRTQDKKMRTETERFSNIGGLEKTSCRQVTTELLGSVFGQTYDPFAHAAECCRRECVWMMTHV